MHGGVSRIEISRGYQGRAREWLRQQGLRSIRIWVPDVRSPTFAAEAHRQSLAVAESPQGDEDQTFVDLALGR